MVGLVVEGAVSDDDVGGCALMQLAGFVHLLVLRSSHEVGKLGA